MRKTTDTSIRFLKGIGPKRAVVFLEAGIKTVEDILYYFPKRYEDRTTFSSIGSLSEGGFYTIKAEVLAGGVRRSFRRKGFSITEAILADQSGKISCVWFNQYYLKNYFKPGAEFILYGKVERYGSKLQMTAPEFEAVSSDSDESLNVGRIVPIYPLQAGLGQRSLRRLVKQACDEYACSLDDILPPELLRRNKLNDISKSIQDIHFPETFESRQEAYRRLSFEEFFLFQLPLAMRKVKRQEAQGIVHQVEGNLVKNFLSRLPFSLTASQQAVIEEIKADMASSRVMQRLLQGDVGSGKTVVATIACLIAAQGGYQAAFMAPTEILAKQHAEKITAQAQGLRGISRPLRIQLLTNSVPLSEKNAIIKQVESGCVDILIGTHSLLSELVLFKRLGLVVIDEQHKFGVGQRALLPQKGKAPDVLIMTATPIPRTLAITLYGDLEISLITELPAGRRPVQTKIYKSKERLELYAFMRENVLQGRQVYVVYPLIEESFALDLLSAKEMHEEFKNSVFKDLSVGLLHGRLKHGEQDKVLSDFKAGKIQILIATTILEVGIDIPNATVMVIEHSDRFGLSQLHQLRGRIGRGRFESTCILVSDVQGGEAALRLEAMVRYSDGFQIAEEDLRIRGPGDFFGSRQHGLAELKIGDPLTQLHLLKSAREEAIKLISADPLLTANDHLLLRKKLFQRFPEFERVMLA